MSLYFYFNETTGDLVYSDQNAYSVSGYTSLGEQTNMSPINTFSWIFNSYRNEIITITKDPAVTGKISGLIKMSYMFDGCFSLTSLDLSGFDTSQVTDMTNMFFGCFSLTSLDLSGFDTSQVTNMASMFSGCSSLTSLDLSGFDTSQVTDMYGMFSGCSDLTSLDLSGFDTSQVTDMNSMFGGCSSLTSLDLSGFDTLQVTDMTNMFFGCSSLTSLDLSGFDTSKVTNIDIMFYDCSSLRLIAVSGSMPNALAQLPASQYYPASGGSPVAKADLTAGTWVRDEADLSKHTTIVQQAQAAMQLRRDVSKAAKRVSALEAKLS